MLIEVWEPSQAGAARRKVTAFATELGMEESRHGEVALVTTELATNLVKHAKGGYILAQAIGAAGGGLRVMAVDKGPGIADVPGALADGNSTAGSMGTGLGAIRRFSDRFEIYSTVGLGTVVGAEFWRTKSQPCHPLLEVGVVSEPISGEEECGDGWSLRTALDTVWLMVVDGLGHGILAAEAARKAEHLFSRTRETSPAVILNDTHAALRKTRGAAEAIAKIETEKKLVSFAGIGNISASIGSPASTRIMASQNGTLGVTIGPVKEFTYPWNPGSVLIMHSDGLTTGWDLGRYPGIWTKTPAVIAAVLHRDFNRERDTNFCRQRDDATVLVAKAIQA